MEKLAIPTPEQQAAEIARLRDRQLGLMEARGATMPLKTQDVYDRYGNVIGQELVEDMENARTSIPGESHKKVLKQKDAAGKVRQKTHRIPGASQAATQPLLERSVIHSTSDVSGKPLKVLKHRTVGPMKRFWSGQGGLGGKWPNRLALMAGLGTLAAGAKTYADSSGDKMLEAPKLEPQPLHQNSYEQQLQPYYKTGALRQKIANPYIQDTANVPKPPGQPRVPSPGPAISAPTLNDSVEGTGLPKATSSSLAAPGSSGGFSAAKVAMDDAMYPLLGAGVGGAGGYILGKKILGPVLDYQEKNLAAKAEAYMRAQKTMAAAKHKAPMTAAVAGAILLAALTAIAARDKRQKSIMSAQPSINPYDPTRAGFEAYQGMPMGNPIYPGNFYG
jgi:hypothetical protein